jgi:hypothetical protein
MMARSQSFRLLLLTAAVLLTAPARAAGRRALLIGIDDYSASRLTRPPGSSAPDDRDWPNLRGAVNDVSILRELLVLLYGFKPEDIVTLTDQGATRAAILQAIDRRLIQPAAKGDVLFYYFAGHGSQVPNSRSDEPDKLDESIIPADSRLGAPDIRDKELRVLFNRVLDRGAFLTLLLDHCHSGSGFRGLTTGAHPRGIRRAADDIKDATPYGPRPDLRGALVLAATQDADAAWERKDDEGGMHGAFTWAWIRALRDAAASESAQETFLRAQARLRGETPYQEPLIAGTAASRLRPFLGTRIDRRGDRVVVAVESVRPDGSVLLQGGWANGLSAGSELTVAGAGVAVPRLTITAILGLGRSLARITERSASGAIRPGVLLEVAGWAAPPGSPLRVWMPQATGNMRMIIARVEKLRAEAAARGIRWITDPTEVTPAYLLRLDSEKATLAAIRRIPLRSSLFVQLPALPALLDAVDAGDIMLQGVQRVASAEEADYILAGRYSGRRMEFAWLRPFALRGDQRRTGLPERTAWIAADANATADTAAQLRDALLRLRRIHGWQRLQAPPGSFAPYRLTLSDPQGKEVGEQSSLRGGDHYSITLRPASPLQHVTPRHYYAFVIDSDGKSFLVYPRGGSVENRFPIDSSSSTDIHLGATSAFRVTPPYGADTYFLLSTDEPLPNPWVLEWDGVRSPSSPRSPLEELLLSVHGRAAARTPVIASRWSIERVVFESVPPAGRKGADNQAIPRHRRTSGAPPRRADGVFFSIERGSHGAQVRVASDPRDDHCRRGGDGGIRTGSAVQPLGGTAGAFGARSQLIRSRAIYGVVRRRPDVLARRHAGNPLRRGRCNRPRLHVHAQPARAARPPAKNSRRARR